MINELGLSVPASKEWGSFGGGAMGKGRGFLLIHFIGTNQV